MEGSSNMTSDTEILEKIKFVIKHKFQFESKVQIETKQIPLIRSGGHGFLTYVYLTLFNLKSFTKELLEELELIFGSNKIQYFITENVFLISNYEFEKIENYYKTHYVPPIITHAYLPFAYKGKEQIHKNIYQYTKILITDDFGKLKKGEEYEYLQILLNTNIGEGVITLPDLSSVCFNIKAEPIK